MNILYKAAVLVLFVSLAASCGRNSQINKENKMELPPLSERIKAFADTHISADMSHLDERQKKLVSLLAEAGHLADQVFWKQTSPDAIAVRDSLKKLNTPEALEALKYVMINYGPYDLIYEGIRFVGNGPEKKPAGANLYPIDMSKEEFENYVKAHPDQKDALESQYTVVVRDGKNLKAIQYHEYYPEVMQIAAKLDEAAEYADNPSLKKYLKLRAEALRTDNYFESDMAWMDLKDNAVDVVIGPIENYEDANFNYKTAYECGVFIKDEEGTKELQMYKSHIDDFEHGLPYDQKYIRKTAGSGNVLEVVNIAYFGGDFQKAVKTIAASLPNDPKVHELKGGKKQMFKNMMEAKFDKIVKPIADKIMDAALLTFVDKKAFTSFVTLHEVSHTLGLGFVYGRTDSLSVRKALKEKYSAIEECKADILGMYNHKHLLNMKEITPDYNKKAMVTYIVGLYRSIRFGAEEAHGIANIIQLNFLREKGAIKKLANGKFSIDENIFYDKVAELAKMLLTVEAEGDYNGAVKIINQYGKMSDETKKLIDSLKDIPRDLNTTYDY